MASHDLCHHTGRKLGRVQCLWIWHYCHLRILNHLTFELTFWNWSLMGPWAVCKNRGNACNMCVPIPCCSICLPHVHEHSICVDPGCLGFRDTVSTRWACDIYMCKRDPDSPRSFLWEPELTPSAERKQWLSKKENRYGAWHFPSHLSYFPTFANHTPWKWGHGGKGKDGAALVSSPLMLLAYQSAKGRECWENVHLPASEVKMVEWVA